MAVHPDVAALLTELGVPPEGNEGIGAVHLEGAEPVYPTTVCALPLGRASASVMGAVGALAARLHHLRTGVGQSVSLRVEHAGQMMSSDIVVDGQDGAAMRGARCPFHPPAPAPTRRLRGFGAAGTTPGMDPAMARFNALRLAVMGIFECRDGRSVFLHSSFNPLGVVEFLQLPEDFTRKEIAARIATWDSFELEEAMAARNLCCNVIRSYDEWTASPVGAALAATPVCEVQKVADGPPIPFSSAAAAGEQRPLSGVRVLDLSRVLAGPMCARTFAEHGADVLKVANSDLPDMRAPDTCLHLL